MGIDPSQVGCAMAENTFRIRLLKNISKLKRQCKHYSYCGVWWTLHKLRIGGLIARILCFLGWYRRFHDGRCMYCGIIHSKAKCNFCEGIGYSYGVAPHVHDMSATGSIIGSTKILPKTQWPKQFMPDPENESCGTWFCEHCQNLIRLLPPK